MKVGTSPGWRAVSEWRDGPGPYDMTRVWRLEGPAPFGGLGASSEDQALDAADMLNRLYNREPWVVAKAIPDDHPVAASLGAAISADPGVTVSVRGMTISVTAVTRKAKP